MIYQEIENKLSNLVYISVYDQVMQRIKNPVILQFRKHSSLSIEAYTSEFRSIARMQVRNVIVDGLYESLGEEK